jgi:hypothetical protein
MSFNKNQQKMATIDILIVIDANSIVQDVNKGSLGSGSAIAPQQLGAWGQSDAYIYMIADGAYVVSNQGKSELSIQCNVNDTIRWTITNPSAGLYYNCMLYGFTSSVNGGIGTYITAPVVNTTAATSYYNNPLSVTTPDPTAYMLSAWSSTALAETSSLGNNGALQYNCQFQVIDTGSGTVVGYFEWDPFIVIN